MKKLFLCASVLVLFYTNAYGDSTTSGLSELSTPPAADDLMQIIDKSDTTMSANGTNKKIQYKTLSPPIVAGGSASVNAPSSYYVCTGTCTITPPAPVANIAYQFCIMNDTNISTVITLEAIADVQYENSGRTALCTANHQIKSGGAVGDYICIAGYGTTRYYTVSSKGTWTCQ